MEEGGGLLDRIVDAIADPLFVKDREHRWIVVNRAFCEFMGHPREALIGKSDYDFFSRQEAETFWTKDAEVFESGEMNINEEPLTDADGRRHIIVTKKSVFRTADGEQVLVGIIRDVTGTYTLAFGIFAIVFGVAFVTMMLATPPTHPSLVGRR